MSHSGRCTGVTARKDEFVAYGGDPKMADVGANRIARVLSPLLLLSTLSFCCWPVLLLSSGIDNGLWMLSPSVKGFPAAVADEENQVSKDGFVLNFVPIEGNVVSEVP